MVSSSKGATLEELPPEIQVMILLQVDDATSLRNALLSCKTLYANMTTCKRLPLYALLGRKLVPIAAATLAAAKVKVGDGAEVRRYLSLYLSRQHLPTRLLPSTEEARPLHRAVCYFTDEFLAETWAVLPTDVPPRLLGPPSCNETLRVRHTFYVHECLSRLCGVVDGKDKPIMSKRLRKRAWKSLSCNECLSAWEVHRFLYMRIDGLMRDRMSDYDERRRAVGEPTDGIVQGKEAPQFRGAIAASTHSGLEKLHQIMVSQDCIERLWHEATSVLSTPERRDNIRFGYFSIYIHGGSGHNNGEHSFFEDGDTGLFNTNSWTLAMDFDLYPPYRLNLLVELSYVNNAIQTEDQQYRFIAPIWDRWRIEGLAQALFPTGLI